MNIGQLYILVLVSATLVLCSVTTLGWKAILAKRYLMRAVQLMQRLEFTKARESVLVAVRQQPSLKRNSDIQRLYEIIVTKPSEFPVGEVERINSRLLELPKTGPERLMRNPWFVGTIILLMILPTILRLFGSF